MHSFRKDNRGYQRLEVVGDGKLLLHGYGVSVWDDKEVLEMDEVLELDGFTMM